MLNSGIYILQTWYLNVYSAIAVEMSAFFCVNKEKGNEMWKMWKFFCIFAA